MRNLTIQYSKVCLLSINATTESDTARKNTLTVNPHSPQYQNVSFLVVKSSCAEKVSKGRKRKIQKSENQKFIRASCISHAKYPENINKFLFKPEQTLDFKI